MVAPPHGGKLVNRVVRGKERERLLSEIYDLRQIELPLTLAVDVENIAHGVYSPLEGFILSEDYEAILHEMRLSNDIPWTIPITLDVSHKEIKGIREGDSIALMHKHKPLAVMKVEEIYTWDKKEYALRIFKTKDLHHPGVMRLIKRKELLIGGPIKLIGHVPTPFERYTLWPIETRILFREKGWRAIAGFQTRNVPHLGHEYIQKAALTFVDGLFINPLIGWKRPGDYKDEVIIAAYEVLIEKYYPKNSVIFSVLRMEMKYAGPREAIHHAIIRKNFGCTHFIVGRDHAGVGNYYKPYEAWELFHEFPDLGIIPLFIREAFYCTLCKGIVNEKICPHNEDSRIYISGTKIREIIKAGHKPPEHVMRPEVAEVILKFKNPFT